MKTKMLILMIVSLMSATALADGSRPVRVNFEFTNLSDKTVSSINLGRTAVVCEVNLENCKGSTIATATESGVEFIVHAEEGFKGKFRYSIEGAAAKTLNVVNSVDTKLVY